MQQLTIIGNIAWKNADLRYTSKGQAVMDLSIAVSRRERNSDQDTTTWYRVTLWGKQAEVWDEKLRDKAKAGVFSGELTIEEFTRRDGSDGYALKIPFPNCAEVTAWKDRGTDDAADNAPPRKNAPVVVDDITDEDIPF